MIKFILDIAKLFVAVVPIVFLCLLMKKINLSKPNRSRQFLMPVLSVGYVIVSMTLSIELCEWLLTLLKNIPIWIKKLADFSWMPEGIDDIIKNSGDFIENILRSVNLKFWIFFIANIAIILAYYIYKKICILILNKVFAKHRDIHDRIVSRFYEYFYERGVWCVKDEYAQSRGFLRAFFYGAIILSSILMIISRWLYFHDLVQTVFYPIFGIIIVGELYFFLDGITKSEYTNDVLGEEEYAYRTVNYSLIRKFLRSVFGDKLNAENTTINNAIAYSITNDEIIHSLETNEDPKVVSFATYIKKLNSKGFKLNHSYLYSSLDLLNGKSILFNNPFYNDLIPYAFYPMNRMLLEHKKVLVVLGRHAIENNIMNWIYNGIESVTNIPFMWNVGVLNIQEQNSIDIGIISRSDVLNIDLHQVNSDFLSKVGYVVIIEPSKLISTAQIGLNLLIKEFSNNNQKIVYCLCDKNCDGLIDAMSHILMTNITEVTATDKHSGTSSYMCWNADDEYLHHRLLPNISRYLGVGTELSFAALKNQVSKTQWYGGDAFPVKDVSWIDKQYYYDLLKYAGLPTDQKFMDEVFLTSSDFWSATVSKNNFFTVEDESYNMFEIVRNFATRSYEQGFINVISSEYLLKEYMSDNSSIFEADAKAIPYIVADYARTNRNIIFRIMLMMCSTLVNEEMLVKEFSLIGVNVFNLQMQLWYEIYMCYADATSVKDLVNMDYRQAVGIVSEKSLVLQNDIIINKDIIVKKEHYNSKKCNYETIFTIINTDFISLYISELKSAGYIAEDEKGEKYYLGSELKGHIYQKYLPGQFFTFDGKYYEMQYLTADGQVLVRRAADHINGRPDYRQIRNYEFTGFRPSEQIGSSKDISGMKLVREYADIKVSTDGYWLMKKYNDFSNAKKVDFDNEFSKIPEREYRNKEILRIDLPDINSNYSANIRYTITVLLNEVFRTIFAENHAFIVAITDESFIKEDKSIRPNTYTVNSNLKEFSKNSIYIVEDSQLDFGLTITVERNINRILEIIQDYLDWHITTMKKSLTPPEETSIVVNNLSNNLNDATKEENLDANSENKEEKKKKKGVLQRIKEFFKRIFIRKKKSNKPDDTELTDIIDSDVSEVEYTQLDEIKNDTKTEIVDSEIKSKQLSNDTSNTTPSKEKVTTDMLANCFKRKKKPQQVEEIVSENEEKAVNLSNIFQKQPYHEKYYLKYGLKGEPAVLDTLGTLNYLNQIISKNENSLKKARKSKKVAEFIEKTYRPNKKNIRYCDFCGADILGVEFETLVDGRDRCITCGRTAVKSEKEFRRIFDDVKRNLESFFGIKINSGVRVEMVNSKKIHKELGHTFTPTLQFDGRVLGVAIKKKDGFSLLVENGSPRIMSMLTIVHELVHIWQYQNWNEKHIKRTYGKELCLQIYEGMAKWVEIQYAYLINEPAIGKREEIITAYRNDEYGIGFLRYRMNYPLTTNTLITELTPFVDINYPLSLDCCGEIYIPPEFLSVPDININEDTEDVDNIIDQSYTGFDDLPTNTQVIKGETNRNSQQINYYYYDNLDSLGKVVYNNFINAISNFESRVTLQSKVVNKYAIDISHLIMNDHPELFWYSFGIKYYGDINEESDIFQFEYTMSKEEVEKRKSLIANAENDFLSSVRSDMSDFEALLSIYENLINLVDYDSVGLEEQNTNGKGNKPDDLRSIYGALVNKKAVCAGYAKAFQYLLNRIGVPCLYVNGYADNTPHAWNIVKLEGEYYHIDVTWGDYSDTKTEKNTSDEVDYAYFCLDKAEISIDHTINQSIIPVPDCNSKKCNYYVRNNLCFNRYSFIEVQRVVINAIVKENKSVSFKIEDSTEYNIAVKELFQQGAIYRILQYANVKLGRKVDSSSCGYSTQYQNKGILKIHFNFV